MNPEPLSAASEQRRKLERELIGSLAGNCADTIESAGWFDADLFLHPGYADLWRWTVAAHPDSADFWRKASDLSIRDTVLDAMTETLSWSYGEHLAREIVQLAWLDRANSNVAALTQATARGDTKQAAALLAQLQESQPKQAQPLAVRDMSDAGESFLRILETENRSILTGIPVLDNATGGLERQSQTILAAPPSTGKSALSFQIARNVAASGKKALFVSLEMAEANLFARAACGVAGVTWQDVKRGNLSPAQRDRVRDAASELMFTFGRRLLIHDQTCDTPGLWQMVAAQRPDVVVVDHIRFLTDDHGENENKRLGWLSKQLRDIAKQFDCHVLVLAQLSRSSKERSDKRPILTDLRDSGELEENADNVWMLYVPVDNTTTLTNRNTVECEVWIRKARDGVRDACVYLDFDRRQQWFAGKEKR
jgi:replicative DNA helicase